MTLITRPAPFGELLSLGEAIDSLFDESLLRPVPLTADSNRGHRPVLDVYATPEAVLVEAEVPGVKPEDIEVRIQGETLTISGHFEQEQEVGYYCRELSHGSFSRAFVLPAAVKPEEGKATLKDGLLRITIPKFEEATTRQIKVDLT